LPILTCLRLPAELAGTAEICWNLRFWHTDGGMGERMELLVKFLAFSEVGIPKLASYPPVILTTSKWEQGDYSQVINQGLSGASM
jgi:hypothetical protein